MRNYVFLGVYVLEFNRIIDDIYRLETPVTSVFNGIIFIDGEQKVLIDSGIDSKNIDECLVPALKVLGYTLDDVDWLLNTHCHGDHVGGHKRITQLSNAKVATFKESVPKMRDPLKYSKLIRATFPENSPPPPAVLEGVDVDLVLEEGDIVANRLQLVVTKGHDDDCVCFYDLKTKSLITGDSLQGNGTASQGTALYMDLDEYKNTLEKLKKMDIENIISGHPYLVSGDVAFGKASVGDYINKCENIVETYDAFIRKELENGETDIATISIHLIKYMNNIEPKFLFLPMYTVKEHIKNILKNR